MDQILAGGSLVALLALIWGPLVLLFIWRDQSRWWFLASYIAAMFFGLILLLTAPTEDRHLNPPLFIVVVLAWGRLVYRAWRARRAPIALTPGEEIRP